MDPVSIVGALYGGFEEGQKQPFELQKMQLANEAQKQQMAIQQAQEQRAAQRAPFELQQLQGNLTAQGIENQQKRFNLEHNKNFKNLESQNKLDDAEAKRRKESLDMLGYWGSLYEQNPAAGPPILQEMRKRGFPQEQAEAMVKSGPQAFNAVVKGMYEQSMKGAISGLAADKKLEYLNTKERLQAERERNNILLKGEQADRLARYKASMKAITNKPSGSLTAEERWLLKGSDAAKNPASLQQHVNTGIQKGWIKSKEELEVYQQVLEASIADRQATIPPRPLQTILEGGRLQNIPQEPLPYTPPRVDMNRALQNKQQATPQPTQLPKVNIPKGKGPRDMEEALKIYKANPTPKYRELFIRMYGQDPGK